MAYVNLVEHYGNLVVTCSKLAPIRNTHLGIFSVMG